MKPKLFVIILVLVILPAVILSLMAARSLENWDLILHRRLEVQAAAAVRAVSERLDGLLEDERARIVAAISGVYTRGCQPSELRVAATELSSTSELVDGVYVFVNPWDFLYPPRQSPSVGGAGEPDSLLDPLLAAVRAAVVSASSPQAPLSVHVGARSFYFGLVSMRGVYAGFEVNRDVMRREVDRALAYSSGGLIMTAKIGDDLLVPEGVDWPSAVGVFVADSFDLADPASRAGAAPEPDVTDVSADGSFNLRISVLPVLAEHRLAPPFEYIVIRAHPEDSRDLQRVAATRQRVYGWVILLMVVGIVAGVWMLWHASAEEIKRARSRSNYVAGVSHDLRTPLAAMRMLAETLALGKITDPEKQQRFLDTMVKECDKLSHLVERVLFFVRYGQGALVFNLDQTDVGALVREAVEGRSGGPSFALRDYGGQAGGGGGPNVRVNVVEHLPNVRADRGAITQVITNLLDNATKYGGRGDGGEEGGGGSSCPPIDIDIRVDVVQRGVFLGRADWLRVAVRDFGIGIEKSAQRKIFRRFYRSPLARDQNVSGVGLGLALCQHIVQAHGGKIAVESDVGKGSTFTVYLPVGKNN